MVEALGWLNLLLIIGAGMIYPLKKLQFLSITRAFGRKSKDYNVLHKKARKFHPIMGMLTIIAGFTHGYLALGTIRWHTGSLILLALILMALLAIFGPKIKVIGRRWRNYHRGCGILLIGFVLLHLFWRN